MEERTVDTIEYYEAMNDMVFLLANTPTIPDFNYEKEQDKLELIEERCRTDKSIRMNSQRFLIVGRK